MKMQEIERFPPDDPREWMNRARSNLAVANNRTPGVYLEDLCFQAQQAAEKAIKSVMIRRGVELPYSHNLERLLTMLEDKGETIPNTIREADALSQYAWVARCPGIADSVTVEQYERAIEIAEAVVRWADERL